MDARYVKYWEDYGWKSGPPAADPRQAHHRQFVPDPEFVLLCDEAERLNLRVELAVGKPYGPENERRSDLTAIKVSHRIVAADSRHLTSFRWRETIRVVASRARERLAAA